MIGTRSEVSAGLCTRKFKYGLQSREPNSQSFKGGFVGNPVLYVTVKDSKSPPCVSYLCSSAKREFSVVFFECVFERCYSSDFLVILNE